MNFLILGLAKKIKDGKIKDVSSGNITVGCPKGYVMDSIGICEKPLKPPKK